MVFSKEEKEIWANSEVMRELERIAQSGSIETPEEAFLPIGEGWESERSDEEKLMDALKDFEEENSIPKQEEELSSIMEDSNLDLSDEDYLEKKEKFEKEQSVLPISEHSQIETANLINGLTKLAAHLGKQGKVIAACRIEDTIKDIRIALREAKNG
jgi:hypothetical protein